MTDYKNPRLPTGAEPIDQLLGGGIEYGAVTNVFGPAGSGKSNLSLMASCSAANAGKTVVFIDTEGGFSPERLAQLCDKPVEEVSKNILILEPKSFDEQQAAVKKLQKMVREKDVGLVVVDSLVSLYRLEMSDNVSEANKRLSEQLSILSQVARENDIPILVTNQIYSDFDSGEIEIVSSDVAKYWSKCLLELKKVGEKGKRVAIIRKHRSRPEGEKAQFKITERGIAAAKAFSLF